MRDEPSISSRTLKASQRASLEWPYSDLTHKGYYSNMPTILITGRNPPLEARFTEAVQQSTGGKFMAWRKVSSVAGIAVLFAGMAVQGQMIDNTQAPSTAKAGINKSLLDEIGPGRGSSTTPGSSVCMIQRDPFRSVRRGRQLFQRKFTHLQGQGPSNDDGVGDLNTNKAIGAGLSDSCASCHGRPRGSGGVGGNVVTRPDSRDAGHLFGLGLKEMLADEMTTDLRATRDSAIAQAQKKHRSITLKLVAKGVGFGTITGNSDGSVDTSGCKA